MNQEEDKWEDEEEMWDQALQESLLQATTDSQRAGSAVANIGVNLDHHQYTKDDSRGDIEAE